MHPVLRFCSILTLPLWIHGTTGCSRAKSAEPRNLIKVSPISEEDLLERAMNAYDHGLYTLAAESWTDLRDNFPGSRYSTLADMKIADAQFASGNYDSAIVSYEEFVRVHPGHEAIPYVRYQIALCHYQQARGPTRDQAPLKTALRLFTEMTRSYPESLYTTLARRRIQEAREQLAQHELAVAEFYEKQGMSAASQHRRVMARQEFPEDERARNAAPPKKPNLNQPAARSGPGIPQLALRDRTQGTNNERAAAEEAELALRTDTASSDSELDSSTLLLTVECTEQENVSIATAYLRAPVRPSIQQSGLNEPTQYTFAVSDPKRFENVAFEPSEKACNLQRGSVTFRTKVVSSAPAVTAATAGASHATVFTLDRPTRLVTVLQ